MIKLAQIKYLFSSPQIVDLPKYFVLVGLLYSALIPLAVGALDVSLGQYSKPALLAIANIQPVTPVSPVNSAENNSKFTLLFGSAIAGQANPTTPSQIIKPPKFSVSPSIIVDDGVSGTKEIRNNVIVTAYSSTEDQTDASPFITAMGSHVRDGIAAANFLKFGTKIRLPEIYGDKIFVVEDRMAKKNSHKVDIWMESRGQALQFGVKRLTLEILE